MVAEGHPSQGNGTMSRKALIVEDEIELAELLAAHLRQWGFEPHIHGEGKGAVDWVRRNQPDLLLLDLMLPDIDGYTICENLKLDRDPNLIPIVMVTGLSGQEDRTRGLEVGANQYVCKPFTAPELHTAIQNAFAAVEDMKRNGTDGEIHFRLRSEQTHLEELNQLLGSLFLFSGLTQHQVKQLITAVRELGTNAIEWGNKKQAELVVNVFYRI